MTATGTNTREAAGRSIVYNCVLPLAGVAGVRTVMPAMMGIQGHQPAHPALHCLRTVVSRP